MKLPKANQSKDGLPRITVSVEFRLDQQRIKNILANHFERLGNDPVGLETTKLYEIIKNDLKNYGDICFEFCDVEDTDILNWAEFYSLALWADMTKRNK